MTAFASPPTPSALVTRPYDAPTERPYVFATARAVTASLHGGRLCHFPTVCRHVDAILESAVVVVATFESDAASILGYVAWGLDGSIEFLVLNKVLAEDGRPAPGEPAPKGYRLHARKLALKVIQALLHEDKAVVMRRVAARWVMDAMLAAGFNPSVVPKGV